MEAPLRVVFALFLLLCSVTVSPTIMPVYGELLVGQTAMPHFGEALKGGPAALPGQPAAGGLQALVNNSDQRFARRTWSNAPGGLRMSPADPQPALQFFGRHWGAASSPAETGPLRATSWPRMPMSAPGRADATRRLLIRFHIWLQAPPTARAAGAEVSFGAWPRWAADSPSSMVPGLFGGEQRRCWCRASAERFDHADRGDIDNTLLYVCTAACPTRSWTSSSASQSAGSKAYYQAALAARHGLAGESGKDLQPAQQEHLAAWAGIRTGARCAARMASGDQVISAGVR